MNRTKHILAQAALLSLVAFFALGIASAFAAETTSYKPLTSLPGVFEEGQVTNPASLIRNIYTFAIGAGSVLAVLIIIIAGIKYMYQDSIGGKSHAKEQITNALLGLLIILGSYIFLYTLNSDLVNINLDLGNATSCLGGNLVAADGKTVMKDANGQPIKCADSDVLNKLTNQASQDIAVLRATQTDYEAKANALAETTKKQGELKSQYDALYKADGTLKNPADQAKADALKAQIDSLAGTAATQKAAADASKAKNDAAGAQATYSTLLAKALQAETAGTSPVGSDGAAKAISELQGLRNAANDQLNDYSSATSSAGIMNATISTVDQSIALVRAANSLGDSNQTINTSAALAASYSTINGAIQMVAPSLAGNPAALQSFQSTTIENLTKLRNIAAQKLSCSVDKVTFQPATSNNPTARVYCDNS